jgi:hypothetical protein
MYLVFMASMETLWKIIRHSWLTVFSYGRLVQMCQLCSFHLMSMEEPVCPMQTLPDSEVIL